MLWPSGGILTTQIVNKHPMIFRSCWILLKFCTKLLWILTFSGESIILGLVLSQNLQDFQFFFATGFRRWCLWMCACLCVGPLLHLCIMAYLENGASGFFLHKAAPWWGLKSSMEIFKNFHNEPMFFRSHVRFDNFSQMIALNDLSPYQQLYTNNSSSFGSAKWPSFLVDHPYNEPLIFGPPRSGWDLLIHFCPSVRTS